jgi:hypothetical protein
MNSNSSEFPNDYTQPNLDELFEDAIGAFDDGILKLSDHQGGLDDTQLKDSKSYRDQTMTAVRAISEQANDCDQVASLLGITDPFAPLRHVFGPSACRQRSLVEPAALISVPYEKWLDEALISA